ncbi:protein phosphatase 1 regulatory subunit 37 homolog isoform X2 [Lineus longissimus]|uniref:protein phosphatase 1 regulatory subunit 37 homolog isoform X2 n=1 Tax=Lineus longissimus TaxID=88925 RepID=UPI002B4F1090
MGGNLISCHGDKKGYNPFEVYGLKLDGKEPLPMRPKAKDNNYTSLPIKAESVQQTYCENNNSKMNHTPDQTPNGIGKISNGRAKRVSISDVLSVTHSSSCPSSPCASGRRASQRPPPKPPRMRSYADNQYNTIDCTRRILDESLKRAIREINTRHGSLGQGKRRLELAEAGEWVDSTGGNFVSLTPNKFASSRTSLLTLPIAEKYSQVYSLCQDVLQQMLEPDAILGQCVERGLITPETELEIMGCLTKQRRSSLLVGAVVDDNPTNLGPFTEILREVPNQKHLGDLVECLTTIIQSVIDIRDEQLRNGVSPHSGSQEDFLSQEECAIFQIDICYCDTETGESVTLDEARYLDKSLEEALEDMGKIKRRSYYEMCALRDWNANLTSQSRVVPVAKVDLYNRKLGMEGVKFLSGVLQDYSCIRELYVAKNKIDKDGVELLSRALVANHGLAKLDLRLNVFGDDGATFIAEALRRNKSLRCLNVTCTGLTGVGMNRIAASLAKNNSLAELDVGFNDLAGSGCDSLAEILKNNAYTKRLRLRHTNLCSEGYSKIFKSLRINSRLSMLDISGNRIGDDGASILAEILLSNRTLLEINLEKCEITSVGAVALSRSLKANTTLKTMDMSMNTIHDEGATALADSMKYNHTLECICVNMCGIGNAGFISLLNALRVNTSITVLKICYNVLGHEEQPEEIERYYLTLESVYEKLSQVLRTRPEVKLLLWGNRLDETFLSDDVKLT